MRDLVTAPPRARSGRTMIIETAWLGAGAAILSPQLTAQTTSEALEEVVVTASLIETPRRELATAVSVIGNEEIELRGYDSLTDILRTQPGIGVSNSGGLGNSTSLRIRGEEAYRTLLIVDGVKAVDPSATQVAPSFDSLLTTGDLERVEILRGPQGFIYGADAGGVVNVITRTGQGDLGGRVGMEIGEFGLAKYDASLGGGGESGDYFFSLTDLGTDGFNAQSADDVLRDNDGADNTTLHTKLGWQPTENLRLQLVVRDVDATAMFDGCFSLITFDTTHDCVAVTEQTMYKLSADQRRGNFRNVFGYSDVDIARDSVSDGQSSFATHGELSRFEYMGSYEGSDTLTLVYGLDLQTEEVVGGELLERDQHGYYVEYRGQIGQSFFFSAGARYDDNEDFGSHTSSRVSAAYVRDLGRSRSMKYRASYGTGFRPPSLNEISYNGRPFGVYAPAAATPLEEETSRGHELGIEYDTGGGLHLEATWFDQQIEDQIVYFFTFDGESFLDGYIQSPGRSTSTGVELAVVAPLGDRLSMMFNWTNNDTEQTDGSPRLRRPDNLGNLGMQYAPQGGRFRALANYRVSDDAIDFAGLPIDGYQVLDLSFSYSPNDLLEFYARLENVTDERYQEVVGYNTAGRSAYGGVRLRF